MNILEVEEASWQDFYERHFKQISALSAEELGAMKSIFVAGIHEGVRAMLIEAQKFIMGNATENMEIN